MLCKKNKFKKIVEKKRATKARDDLPVVNCLSPVYGTSKLFPKTA